MADETQGSTRPCFVVYHEGPVESEKDGKFNDTLIFLSIEKKEEAYRRVRNGLPMEFRKDGDDLKPVFHVDPRFPVEMPVALHQQVMADWYADARGKAAKAVLDSEAGREKEAARGAFEREIGALGADGKAAVKGTGHGFVARFFASDPNPELTGKIAKASFADQVLVRGESPWFVAVVTAIFGWVEGWQMADLWLPDAASSPWFAGIVPLLAIGAIIWMAVKGKM